MAKVTGPLMSVSASGTIAKTLTYGTWKGIQWVREWFIPANPNTDMQQNVRQAFTLSVSEWGNQDNATKQAWNEAAATLEAQSGISLFMRRGMEAYIDQIGSDTTPVSVSVSGVYPSDTWTWSDT